jgi:YesN/AraC family two-component response regulator
MTPAAEMGWEIMKRLKENPVTQEIPVIFYSLMTEQDSGTVVEMDYLSKPIGMEELVDALKRHGVKSGRKDALTILVVDDEPGILDMHTQIVRAFMPDGRVLTARDGVKALDLMRTTRVDLVLLDLLMPELDGFGVIKTMQDEASLRVIPVIVLSGQLLTKRDMLRLNQGVGAVLGKGVFSGEEVFKRIEGILSRSQRVGNEGQRLVFQAMGFIHEHYREPISRADIAGNLNVNEQYLSRCFNKEIGIGPMAYLSRYRIEQAKRMLEEGRHSITQVALEVGLSSQSYFSRIFQQETGVSPSAYQRGRRDQKND